MSGFLYFIDGLINPLTEKHISECALDYAFERKPQSGRLVGRTPSGADGCILCDETRGGELAYKPDLQTWRKMPRPAEYAGPDVYIGFYTDKRPGPESLAREKQLPGDLVKLADGQEWLAPRLRFWSGDDGFVVVLPSRAGMDESGEWIIASTDPRYAGLDELVDRLYQAIFLSSLGKHKPLDTVEALNAASTLLALNYTVSKFELGLLEVFPLESGIQCLKDVCGAALDHKRVDEWAQKKTEDAIPAELPGATM